jgi:predicted metalloprotease
MRHPPSRAIAVLTALLVALVLSGCSVVVLGTANAGRPPVDDAPPGEVTIVGAAGTEVDELARNALADLENYWAQQFPDVYGQEFVPLEGGYFSVDPNAIDPAAYPQGVGCGADPREVENNAFYCVAPQAPNSDSITYDRAFLAELADGYGRFVPALVMAHEFGHAVQGRVGPPDLSITTETQADCLAGAWTAWVAAGEAEHSQLREPELDELLRGYLLLRDPVGTGPGEQQAHGSFFDRTSAFQEGFDDGPTACRDNFGRDRVFTQGSFSDQDLLTGGNAPYGELLQIVDRSLPTVWEQAFRDVFSDRFSPPELTPFDGEAPQCADDPADDLVYCADPNVVAFDETDLTRPANELGDFAVATAISLPYSLAVRDQLGLSTGDEEAVRSAVCLTGWYSAKVFNGQGGERIEISPGDIDEAVQFLLTYGGEPTVLPDVGLSGFQLVDSFRNGFVRGLSPCDVGA